MDEPKKAAAKTGQPKKAGKKKVAEVTQAASEDVRARDDVDVTFDDGAVMKKVFDALKELTTSLILDFEPAGPTLSVQATDSSNVCIMVLALRARGAVTRPYSAGVDLASLCRLLKFMGPDDSVEIVAGSAQGGSKLGLSLVGPCMARVTRFELGLLDLDQHGRFNIPDQEYDAVLEATTSEYARVFRDLATIGTDVTLACCEDRIALTTRGGDGVATVSYQGAEPDSGFTVVTRRRDVKVSLSLKYLNSFAKACGLAAKCRLHLLDQNPIRVDFNIRAQDPGASPTSAALGWLRFFLAPRMSDSDDEAGDDADADEAEVHTDADEAEV